LKLLGVGKKCSPMAKRFTDTDKWKKPFLRGLDGAYKLLWFYILDDCDMAGIWQVDFEVARIRTGMDINYDAAIRLFGDRIKQIDKFKWFIPDFISFQYGKLSENNRMHLSVIQILKKHNLYLSPLQGASDGDKDNNKDKVLIKVQDKDKYILVDSKKNHAPLSILEFYEAALNGRQKENGNLSWRDLVESWFIQNQGLEFNNDKHVMDSFSKFYINSVKGKKPLTERDFSNV
jgi:hypothetical protein